MKTINFEKYNLNNDKIFSAMGEMFNARIESAEGEYGCDLHNHLFNEEQTFIHDNEAEEACDSVGTWNAIRLVHTYEKDNFGEVTTDIEPCRIANMLAYIYGEYLLNQVAYLQGDKWDEELTEEDLNIIVEQVEEWLELNLPTESDRYSKREFDVQVWDNYGTY
nr:MAG TPA: hypothetical protein [Caudoviricetes sp.]